MTGWGPECLTFDASRGLPPSTSAHQGKRVKRSCGASRKRLPEGSRSKLKDRTQMSARQFEDFTSQLFAASDEQSRFSHLAKKIMRRADTSRAGGYFRRANGDIRQMKEAATEPASIVEPMQRFKGFSLLFDALPL
jgi:hypothetical protein